MIRTTWLASVAVLALALPGCREKQAPPPQTKATETVPRLASTVHMGDPRGAAQLLGGFHSIENNTWRWTERKFAVELGTPAGAAQKGAILELKLTIPPPSIRQLHSLTLTASVEGAPLPPETYNAEGPQVYHREIPPASLSSPNVKVAFELDKAVPPGKVDARELGVVATSISLTSK